MQHRGEIIENAIRQSGYSITKLAKKLGKSARWMYYMFESYNVPLDYILEIGAIIHYDFSTEIKELKKYERENNGALSNKDNKTNYSVVNPETEYWKNKYLLLLEKYNDLLQETSITQKQKKK